MHLLVSRKVHKKNHPDKEIEMAIGHAEAHNWRVIERSGHAWGSQTCPQNSDNCRCGQFYQMSVWSTPKNAGNHARQLRQKVDGCIYDKDGKLKQEVSNE